MNENEFGQTIGQYDALRRDLAELQECFVNCSAPLFSQLISPLHETLLAKEWDGFIAANSRPGGDWQQWEVFPDRKSCCRFFGNSESHNNFLGLAERGYHLLRRVQRMAEGGNVIMPEGLRVSLPSCGSYLYLGWMSVLYRTAAADQTDALQSQPGYWGRTGQLKAEDTEKWSPPPGSAFPVHPFFEELPDDLFLSSAKAIGLWLDTEQAESDYPVVLPDEPEANGPERPDRFWIDGHSYGPFGETEMKLLECLWGRGGVHFDKVNDDVYGINAGPTGLKSLYKNVNAKFGHDGCPPHISLKNNHFTLEVFKTN